MKLVKDLMLRMLAEDVEDEYNVSLQYDFDEDVIDVIKDNVPYFEIAPMDTASANCIEITNYELDEYYQGLNEDDAFNVISELMCNLNMSDEF